MILCKKGVTPKAIVIVCACANVAEQWGITVTITAGINGTHMTGSLHYEGSAVDVRSRQPFQTEGDKRLYLAAVLKRLGPGYQGILEGLDTPNEHFHFEFDPA